MRTEQKPAAGEEPVIRRLRDNTKEGSPLKTIPKPSRVPYVQLTWFRLVPSAAAALGVCLRRQSSGFFLVHGNGKPVVQLPGSTTVFIMPCIGSACTVLPEEFVK